MKRGERSDVAIYVATHEPVFGGWADPYVGLLVGVSGEDAAGSNVPPGFQLDSKGDSIAEKKFDVLRAYGFVLAMAKCIELHNGACPLSSLPWFSRRRRGVFSVNGGADRFGARRRRLPDR